MTCYFRHLKEVLSKARIEVTKENRREIDVVIRNIVGLKFGNCPDVWREVKKRIIEDEADFVSKLKDMWSKR
ncbi:hypothetical protein HXY33_03265 [Candidatus Bathyarchaeota archaeon]|nr:hypothetical protein [Candidatus Bathyarchaeota archaeon]